MNNTQTKKIPGQIIAFVVAQSKSAVPKRGAEEVKHVRSSPSYTETLPPRKVLKEQTQKVGQLSVRINVKAYMPDTIVVEVIAQVQDIFSIDNIQLKDDLIEVGYKILDKQQVDKRFVEEYTLFCVSGYAGSPEQFFGYKNAMASLLKSEPIALDKNEVENTLASRIQYAQDDLIIVDWDGAFLFDPEGKWDDGVDLLQVANAHLLRLRSLDWQLDQRLIRTHKLVSTKPKVKTNEIRATMRELMALRLQSIIDFEDVERNIKLIGDWYAAKLYELIGKKFHLENWTQSIREKLDSLEDIYTTTAENFSVTAETRAERIQIILWFVLMLGWFTLLFFEVYFAVFQR